MTSLTLCQCPAHAPPPHRASCIIPCVANTSPRASGLQRLARAMQGVLSGKVHECLVGRSGMKAMISGSANGKVQKVLADPRARRSA
eukprot:1159416-Pelagomonas_calceolata.AAC.11